MKSIVLLAFVVIVGAIFSSAQDRVTKTEKLIREMETKLAAALLQGDAASVEAILADDYVEISAQGVVRHKSEIMAVVRARASAPHSVSIGPEVSVGETNLRIYGDTAVLIGLTTTRYQFMEYQSLPQSSQLPAPTATTQERFIKVYSKPNGRWQLVASQVTAVAER
jgi:ketosteroid isomerase-like protein